MQHACAKSLPPVQGCVGILLCLGQCLSDPGLHTSAVYSDT
jgi:hypothetical protein